MTPAEMKFTRINRRQDTVPQSGELEKEQHCRIIYTSSLYIFYRLYTSEKNKLILFNKEYRHINS